MTKNNKNTARYQLSIFLQSAKSFEFNLNGDDLAVLMTIFDFMDSGNKECCFADLETIAKISRVPYRTLARKISKLCKFNIIHKKRTRRQNNYFIGSSINHRVPNSQLQSATVAVTECQGGTPIYNNNYNNNIIKADSEKTIKKISPLLEEYMNAQREKD